MIFHDCSVRAVITAVALCLGILAPPSLLFGDCPGTDLHSELQFLSVDGSDFTLSLEWALFNVNPKQGLCLTAETNKQLSVAEDNYVADSVLDHPAPFVSEESLTCSNFSLDTDNSLDSEPLSFTDYSVVTALNFASDMPIFVFSVTAPFKLYSLPELELDSPLTVLEPEPDLTSIIGSSLLSCVKHLRSTLRTLILTSLPVYWAKWIAQNRLTVGLMCVSVMYGCTLCPLLYYLWTQTQSNKRLVLKLKTVNGLKLSVESTLSVLTWEKENLIEKLSEADSHSLKLQNRINTYSTRLTDSEECSVQLKKQLTRVGNDLVTKLLDTRRELEHYKLLEFEAQEKLVLVEEELEKQKKESLEAEEHLHSVIDSLYNNLEQNKQDHDQALAKLISITDDLEVKLLDTKVKLEKSQLLEFEAQEKLVEVGGQLEKQKEESIKTKEVFCSALKCFTRQLREDKKKSDQVLANIRASQKNLRQGEEKEKTRLLESVSDNSGVNAKDSGVCELDRSVAEDHSDSSLLISIMDH